MLCRRTLSTVVLVPVLTGSALVAAPSLSSAATPPVKISYAKYDSPGSDTGSNLSLNGEYIVIKNTTSTNRSLTGWTLRDKTGYTYRFPTFTLRAGATVTVHTGKGPPRPRTATTTRPGTSGTTPATPRTFATRRVC